MFLENFQRIYVYMLSIAMFLIFSASAQSLDFYSQCGQDKYLYDNFFKDKKNGVFLDIGAHDGITFSNTYFFEKSLGWTGICIEPIPEVFEKLANCRSALCVQGCVGDRNETVDFLKVSGYPEMLSGILTNYDPRHLERIEKEIILYGGSYEIIPVQCYKLNDLLSQNRIRHVDYLSLDIEGGELDVLKSIDYDTIFIDIIDVENNYNYPDMKEFLNSKGYTLITSIGGQDEIYMKNK